MTRPPVSRLGYRSPRTGFADADLSRRLRRRGWKQADAIDDIAWVFPASWNNADAPAAEEVAQALEQWERAFEAYEDAFADWCRRADDFGLSLEVDVLEAAIGPQPEPPPVPAEDAGATLLATGADGASNTVIGPGFDSDVEHRTYTDRHALLRALDEIETWRYHDPGARLRSSGPEQIPSGRPHRLGDCLISDYPIGLGPAAGLRGYSTSPGPRRPSGSCPTVPGSGRDAFRLRRAYEQHRLDDATVRRLDERRRRQSASLPMAAVKTLRVSPLFRRLDRGGGVARGAPRGGGQDLRRTCTVALDMPGPME